jgi:hypothetical protein
MWQPSGIDHPVGALEHTDKVLVGRGLAGAPIQTARGSQIPV